MAEKKKAKKSKAKVEAKKKTKVTKKVTKVKAPKVKKLKPQKIQKDKNGVYELNATLNDLLEAGCHFGHTIAKTHPKITPYLYTSRDNIQIFDLIKTRDCLQKACIFLNKLAKEGKPIIFIGTKRQAKKIVQEVAKDAGVYYVTERWLGGTITNWKEIQKRLKILAKMKEDWEKGVYKKRPKKEQSLIKKEIGKMDKFFGGLLGLQDLPSALFVVDIKKEKSAISEAIKESIPIVALVDSNSDPTIVDYPIPANDDALKSINLLVSEVGNASKTIAKPKKED
jgi:small subunit ribosomal protein S2